MIPDVSVVRIIMWERREKHRKEDNKRVKTRKREHKLGAATLI